MSGHDSLCTLKCCTHLENVSVQAGKLCILKDVSFHVHCGQVTTLIGPNGAGKSTLLKAILGEIPYSGTIRTDLDQYKDHREVRIGYVPQKLILEPNSPISVLDLFAVTFSKRPAWLGYSKKIHTITDTALSQTGAEALKFRKLGELSGGELQRVLLALSLTPFPDLLLLDEPVTGIDPQGVELFYDMAAKIRKQHHIAILMVSHDCKTAAKYSDKMIFLNKSVVCQGTPGEVLRNPDVVHLFGNMLEEA